MHAVILLVASCYGNWDKLPLDGPLSFSTDFTFPVSGCCTYFVLSRCLAVLNNKGLIRVLFRAYLFTFQVRVRIIEGRQLAGANISPVVRVTMDNQSRQTKVIKSTNKPFYDEVRKSEIELLEIYFRIPEPLTP